MLCHSSSNTRALEVSELKFDFFVADSFQPILSPLSQSSMDSGYSGLMEQAGSSPSQLATMNQMSHGSDVATMGSPSIGADLNHPMQTIDYHGIF